jgi:quinone-modifying oxidoreductase, subunit QmoC
MAVRVNPKLIDELEYFGAQDVIKCYHCGNCSATCTHSDEVFIFPRRSMRFLQMGLKTKLETSIEPWLCYYCGQCSEQCPLGAEPGETMMSLRRWLISRYDFTGISKKFFKSTKLELLFVILIALLAGIGFLFYGFGHGDIHVYDGANAFLPSHFIHAFDLWLAAAMFLLLGLNILRMWYYIMIKSGGVHIPWWLYIKKFYLLPWHFFTQKRYAECESKIKSKVFMPWLVHLGLMLGYVIMLVLVMIFLHRLQSGPEIDWSVHALAYLATVGLLIGTIYMVRGRIKKEQVQYQKSQGSDWIFVVLLMIIVLTGVFQHICHRLGLEMIANFAYVIHLMAVVPWLLRMPFTKWAHMLYRPLAMYFAGIRKNALILEKEGAPISQPIQQAA